MDSLKKYLENLQPSGASSVPKSKFHQLQTDESVYHSDDVNNKLNQKNEKSEEGKMKPLFKRKNFTKQKDISEVPKEVVNAASNNQHALPKTPEITIQDVDKTEPSSQDIIEKIKIKKIWNDLNIGLNGSLSVPELEKFCAFIGMNDLGKKEMESMFHSIDTNHDGKVTLDEFSAGLRYYEKMETAVNKLDLKANTGTDEGTLFSAIDQTGIGFGDFQNIVQYWAENGVANGDEVLEYLNFNKSSPVDLVMLSNILKHEIVRFNLDAVVLVGFISYRKELEYCRSLLKETHFVNHEQKKPKEDNVPPTATATAAIPQNNPYEISLRESQKTNEQLHDKLTKLNEEKINCENEKGHLKLRIRELEEIILKQEEELDAVADLHRKMEAELKILRELKLTFDRSLNQNDRDQIYDLLYKLQQLLESEKNRNLDKRELRKGESFRASETFIEKVKSLEEKLKYSDKRIGELERILSDKSQENKNVQKTAQAPLDSSDQSIEQTSNSLLVSDVTRLKYKLSEVNKQVSTYKTEMLMLRETNNSLENQNSKLISENETLLQQVKSMKDKIEIAINRERAFQMKLKNAEDQKNSVLSLEHKLDTVNSSNKERDAAYQKQINEFEETNRLLLKEKEQLVVSLGNIEEKLQLLQKEQSQNNNKLLLKEAENLRDEIKSLTDDISKKTVIIKKLEEANDRLSVSVQNAIQKLDSAFQDGSNQADEKYIQLHRRNMELECEINKLSRQTRKTELKQNSPTTTGSYGQKIRSLNKNDFILFQFEELQKKYNLQLEQVDATDKIMQELYEENAKLLKSVQRAEENRQEGERKINLLQQKIQSFHHV